jgi:hypothetical protein
MLNEYGGESTPWPLPEKPPQIEETVIELSDTSLRPSVKDVVRAAMQHLDKHPDAALLAYRLLSQRFAISG